MKEQTNLTRLGALLRVSPLLVGVASLTWATDAAAKEAIAASEKKAQSPQALTKGLSEDATLQREPQVAQTLSVDELSAYELPESLDQVTSVSQLSDVQPTDWAFQALQSLVERYGCIAGYPDGTYRGNSFMTRYEFAAGLNACLDQIVALFGGGDTVDPEDLATIRRLQEEFAAELAALRGRVDGLEARTAELEANQFSTTTKLGGEVIFGLSDSFGEAVGSLGDDDPTQTAFGYRVRLNFDTSFTGRDRLRTRLQSGNIGDFDSGVTGTNMTSLGYASNTDNSVVIDDLYYRFPLGDNLRAYVAASMDPDDYISELSPQASSGSGALSRFGRYNPQMRLSDGAGVGLEGSFGDLSFELGYLADDGEDPNRKNGLFNGEQGAFVNLNYAISNNIELGLFYDRHYFPTGQVNLSGSTGSRLASDPFGDDVSASSDSLGAQFLFGLGPVNLSGWFGYTWATAQNDGVLGFEDGDKAEVVNYAVALTAPDFGGEGNLAGLIVGVPPQATRIDNSSDNFLAQEDDDTSVHIEAFYRYALTDNIAITPGFFVVTNPEHQDSNDAQWVATIRTTFKF